MCRTSPWPFSCRWPEAAFVIRNPPGPPTLTWTWRKIPPFYRSLSAPDAASGIASSAQVDSAQLLAAVDGDHGALLLVPWVARSSNLTCAFASGLDVQQLAPHPFAFRVEVSHRPRCAQWVVDRFAFGANIIETGTVWFRPVTRARRGSMPKSDYARSDRAWCQVASRCWVGRATALRSDHPRGLTTHTGGQPPQTTDLPERGRPCLT